MIDPIKSNYTTNGEQINMMTPEEAEQEFLERDDDKYETLVDK